MSNKTKDRLICIMMVLFMAAFAVTALIRDPRTHSVSERRPLAQFPEISVNSISEGRFMKKFEDYASDQFPARDFLRKLKAFTEFSILNKSDNNGIYYAQGHISELDFPLDVQSAEYAAEKFNGIYEKYLKGRCSDIYLCIIPDKNFFIAEANGYPHTDYGKLTDTVSGKMPFAEYIDIFPLLDADDYYRTDTHWKQENIIGVAEHISENMGQQIPEKYTTVSPDVPFYGVYASRYALSTQPDRISYLTNNITDSFIVHDMQNNRIIDVYDEEKLYGNDGYELFLGGPLSLVKIENPLASTDKKLIVFRDSYACSITPLIAQAYAEVILIDIRYLRSDMLGNFVEFDGQDILFLYSTLILNNSETLK